MFYYVYILQSQKDNSFYIGYTTDLIKRFKQHNSGESQATKTFRPYKLLFYEAFLDIPEKLRFATEFLSIYPTNQLFRFFKAANLSKLGIEEMRRIERYI